MESVVSNLLSSWDSISKDATTTLSGWSNPDDHNNGDQKSTASQRTQGKLKGQTATSDGSNDNKHNSTSSNNHTSNTSVTSNFFPDIFKASSEFSISSQISDKFFEKFISMALPPSKNSRDVYLSVADRVEHQKSRPQFSVNIMSKNFIQLNSRLAIPFVFIDEIIDFFSWRNPFLTISVLMIISLFILKPVLLMSFPFLFIKGCIIVPAYMKRHPPERMENWGNNPIPSEDAPLKKMNTFQMLEPVPEISREFMLNLTDLQNHMRLYIIVYDLAYNFINNYCFFGDGSITSFVYLLCGAITITLIMVENLLWYCLPVLKVLVILLMWGFTISLHPAYREHILEYMYSEETRLRILTLTDKFETKISEELTELKEDREMREIEIYELQVLNPETHNWQLVGFSNEIYALNSHIRTNNLPINGVLSLDSVKPPKDWKFLNVPDVVQQTQNGSSLAAESQHRHSLNNLLNELEDSTFNELSGEETNDNKKSINTTASTTTPGTKTITTTTVSSTSNAIGITNSTSLTTSVNSPTTAVASTNSPNPSNISQFKSSTKGWYLDLTPHEWVSSNNLEDVMEIDDDEKWCYDSIPLLNIKQMNNVGVMNHKAIGKTRGEFRRRRWIRTCVRSYARFLEHKQPVADFVENDNFDEVLDELAEDDDVESTYSKDTLGETSSNVTASPSHGSGNSNTHGTTSVSEKRRSSNSFPASLKIFHSKSKDKRKSRDEEYSIHPTTSNDSGISHKTSSSTENSLNTTD